MTESDRHWLSAFLLSCAFWLLASGAFKLDFASYYSQPSVQPTSETQRLDQMLAVK